MYETVTVLNFHHGNSIATLVTVAFTSEKFQWQIPNPANTAVTSSSLPELAGSWENVQSLD